MSRPYVYHVERKTPHGEWSKIPFAEGSKDFCLGWVVAMDCLYPSAPHRVIRMYNQPGGSEKFVVQETPGRGKVHLN